MCVYEGIGSDIKPKAPHLQILQDTYKDFWNQVYLDGEGEGKEK